MIVVVIIGILAAVAIPSYQGFQDKAKNSEAKVGLSGIYAAESAYKAEFDKYSNNLTTIGVGSLGSPKYFNMGFPNADGCVIKGAVTIVTCASTNLPSVVVKPAATVFTAGAGKWKDATTITALKGFTIDQDRTVSGPL